MRVNPSFHLLIAVLVMTTASLRRCEAADPPFKRTMDWTTTGELSQPLVRVKLADGKTWLFMIDTGSPGTLLDRKIAVEMRLPTTPYQFKDPDETVDLVNTPANIGPDVIPFPSLPFALADLSAMRQVYPEIAGIIGTNFLDNFVVGMDYSKKQMTLTVDLESPELQKQVKESRRIPIRKQGEHYVVDAALDANKKVEFILDTGATRTFISSPTVLNSLKPKAMLKGFSAAAMAGRGQESMLAVSQSAVLRFDRLAVSNIVWKDPAMDRLGVQKGNGLGNDFFQRSTVLFDFKGKALYLRPDPAFREDTDRWNGIGADLVIVKGEVVVGRVLSPSPAKNAGIAVGDVVVSINGQAVKNPSAEELGKLIEPFKKLGATIRLEITQASKRNLRTIDLVSVKLL